MGQIKILSMQKKKKKKIEMIAYFLLIEKRLVEWNSWTADTPFSTFIMKGDLKLGLRGYMVPLIFMHTGCKY